MSKGFAAARPGRIGFCAGNSGNGPRPGHHQGLLRLRHFSSLANRAIVAMRHCVNRIVEQIAKEYEGRRNVPGDGLQRLGWDVKTQSRYVRS